MGQRGRESHKRTQASHAHTYAMREDTCGDVVRILTGRECEIQRSREAGSVRIVRYREAEKLGKRQRDT